MRTVISTDLGADVGDDVEVAVTCVEFDLRSGVGVDRVDGGS